jgi:hypothetical protein
MDSGHLTPPSMPGPNGTPELHGRGPMSHVDIMLAWALWWIQVRGRLIFPVQINGKRPAIPHGFKGRHGRRAARRLLV